MKIKNIIPRFMLLIRLFLVATITLLSLGCTTLKLISDYDEKTDEAITSLQRKFETFFVTLESNIGTKEATYGNNVDFYQQVKVDISAIHLRARALPQNEITEKQITLLKENVELLEEFHREGINTIEAIQPARDDFNRALSNILKLELAKKRGEGS